MRHERELGAGGVGWGGERQVVTIFSNPPPPLSLEPEVGSAQTVTHEASPPPLYAAMQHPQKNKK
jgi:hypothetical protein